ncbi:hypothetical protein BV22DRAFT_902656 [Leucogyrophana mollusca]|uniref:Uncharacterized protein n=1 Tax=Leucogyrophana mollusca TaxID=85980 RepID=A0ACB8AZC2_9AGAM|nr:hypothetical protein BV22DRAFT_902656 [Leucogyrophana mollusca]
MQPLLETELNNAAGVPESGAELPGTANWTRTRTQSPKMMMQSRTMRTRGAWTPFVSGSTSGGGGTCRGSSVVKFVLPTTSSKSHATHGMRARHPDRLLNALFSVLHVFGDIRVVRCLHC